MKAKMELLSILVLCYYPGLALSCDAPTADYAQAENGKFYKFTWSGKYFAAFSDCAEDGATLAKPTSQDDVDAIDAFMSENYYSGDQIWSGLTNRDFVTCSTAAECQGKLFWADGSQANQDTTSHVGDVDVGGDVFCVTFDLSNNHVDGLACTQNRPYLCEFECGQQYGSSLFDGYCYQEFAQSEYDAAKTTCSGLGGTLPTLDTESNFKGAKMLAGFLHHHMWLGLKTKDGATIDCQTVDECTAQLYHDLASPADFAANSWFDVGLEIEDQNSNRYCTAMRHDDLAVEDKGCTERFQFFCRTQCEDPPDETVTSGPCPPTVAGKVEGGAGSGHWFAEVGSQAYDKNTIKDVCTNVGMTLASIKTSADLALLRSAGDSIDDAWTDLHSPTPANGILCDSTDPVTDCAGVAIEHLDTTAIDLSVWGKVKVDDDTHKCMKYKKSDNGKLEDEDCSKSKPALCYHDCSGVTPEDVCPPTVSGVVEGGSGSGHWYAEVGSQTYDKTTIESVCTNVGMTLVSLKTSADLAQLRAAGDSIDDAWTDLHSPTPANGILCDSTDPVTDCAGVAIEHLDTTAIDLSVWGKVKVDDDTHKCMKYKKSDNGKLEDEDCSQSKPALCYKNCNEVTTTTPAPTTVETCPLSVELAAEGYEKRNGKAYKLYAGDRLSDAYDKCREFGGSLAMLKTQEDLTAAQHYFAQVTGGNMWTGLVNPNYQRCNSNEACRSKLFWIDGTPATDTLSHLGTMGADDVPASYCLRMRNDDGGMGDYWCNADFPFLCQHDCENVLTQGAPDCGPPVEATADTHMTRNWDQATDGNKVGNEAKYGKQQGLN